MPDLDFDRVLDVDGVDFGLRLDGAVPADPSEGAVARQGVRRAA